VLSSVVIAALNARQPLPASRHVSASGNPVAQGLTFPQLAHSSHQPQFGSPLFSITCALLCRVPSDHRVSFQRVANSSRKKPGGAVHFFLRHGSRNTSRGSRFGIFLHFPYGSTAICFIFRHFRIPYRKKGGGRGYPHTDYPSHFGTRLPRLASPQRQCTPTISGRSRLPQRQTSVGPWRRRRALSSSCTPGISGA